MIRTAARDAERLLEWRDGLIEFDDTLAEAVEEFNRYSAQTIRIEDLELAKLPISAVFRTNSQRKFLEAVTSLHPLAIETNTLVQDVSYETLAERLRKQGQLIDPVGGKYEPGGG